MYSIFKMFFKPILPVDTITTPFVIQSTNSTVNMENIATMFNTFNTTAQTMIQMNSDYLATISRLSDDIGTMSERIGLMADKIEETEVLQSANFLSVQSNTTAVVGSITDSTIFTIMTSDVVSSMTIPTISTDYSMSNSELIYTLFPTSTSSNAALVASMVLSFSDTINSMIEVNTDYINTAIKLGNDVGKMTVRIGQMADKIVDTMAIQNANLLATTSTTTTTTTTTTTDSTITDTTALPAVDSSLTSAALDVSNTINGLTASFSSTMNDIVTAANTNNSTVHGIVEMFMAANLIIRDMITLNTQFLTTVLSLSDEIGMMAHRIGYMADEIVDIQKDFSPLYLSTHDVSGTTDATQATLTASNGTLHTTADAINIYLDSINAVSSSSSLAMPFDIATIGDMTTLFISIIKGLANTDMGTINMDEVTSMFVTANETVQMMMGMNDQYLTAVLRLSDDIGLMADRIVETQEIQSENFLATYHDGVNLMLIGDASINTLTGGLGADILDGKVGADTMIGGAGNDTYYVDNSLDIVTETSTLSTEIDTVKSSISYTLGSNVENLTLFGTAAINGTGNTLNNVINGNASANILSGGTGNDILNGFEGSDTLFGGTGNDTLTGGAGNDIFVFNTAINTFTNRDTITDFTSGVDKFYLENAIFTKLTATGTLSAANFASNVLGIATDFNDYIIYNTITGTLSYDADGIGIFYSPTQIALLGTLNHPTITAADFTVI